MTKEIFKVFLKLGILGFGGPAAHIAMMREEVVVKRHWLTEKEFLDLIGASHLIPGPNSTELAIHVGYKMGGYRGLLTAGLSFILPAFISVLVLAVMYEKYGTLPEADLVLSGIRPVVTAIVILALLNFRKNAIPGIFQFFLAIIALGLSFYVNEIFVIIFTGVISYLAGTGKKFSVMPELFFVFMKIGSVLFGSGYVLLAFLESEFIDQRGWITKAQLIDAVSVGQFTPGPVFTTATFIGYLIEGYGGAVLATIGIFLPSFIFVALSAPFLSKLRDSKPLSLFLDGVIAGSFALMAWVTFVLGKAAIVDWQTATLSFMSFLILWRFPKFNSAWLIILGGLMGYIFFSAPSLT